MDLETNLFVQRVLRDNERLQRQVDTVLFIASALQQLGVAAEVDFGIPPLQQGIPGPLVPQIVETLTARVQALAPPAAMPSTDTAPGSAAA